MEENMSDDDDVLTEPQRLVCMGLMLKMNATQLTQLYIGNDTAYDENQFAPYDGDWETVGVSIGNNTQLKGLYFMRNHEVPEGQYTKFFRGIAKNRSIESLSFHRNNYYGGKIFDILTTFFAKNRRFRELRVEDTIDEPTAIHHIVASLMKAKSPSLEHLELTEIGDFLGDQNEVGDSIYYTLRNSLIDKFFSSLAGLPSLRTLVLSGCCIGKKATVALSSFLSSDNCRVNHLNLARNGFDDDSVHILVDALAEETNTVEELIMAECGRIESRGWEELATLLQLPGSKIKTFSCAWTTGGNVIASSLANSSNSTLKKLVVARTGAVYIPRLGLDSVLTDDTVISLIDAMARRNVALTQLDISDCASASSAGFAPLCSYLSHSDCILEELKIFGVPITDDRATFLADALLQNKSLTLLGFSTGRNDEEARMTDAKWGLLTTALCNPTSIDATYSSNHTLQEIDTGYGLSRGVPRDLKMWLDTNRLSRTKTAAAHLKIYIHHFKQGNFSMEPFADMEAGILPYTLAWFCKEASDTDRAALSYLYRLLKNKSSLLDFGRGQKVRANGRSSNKRKRRSGQTLGM